MYDEYDAYSITSLDPDSDLVNLNLADFDNDESHGEDISINSCSDSGNLQFNVNADHSLCTNKIDSNLFDTKNFALNFYVNKHSEYIS